MITQGHVMLAKPLEQKGLRGSIDVRGRIKNVGFVTKGTENLEMSLKDVIFAAKIQTH